MDSWTSGLLVPVDSVSQIVQLPREPQRRMVTLVNMLDGWTERFHPCAKPCRVIEGWHGLVDLNASVRNRPRNDRATRLANAAGWHSNGFWLVGPVVFTGCGEGCTFENVPCDLIDTAKDIGVWARSPLADKETNPKKGNQ